MLYCNYHREQAARCHARKVIDKVLIKLNAMKLLQLLIIFGLLSVISCEKNDPQHFSGPVFKIGDNVEFNYNDFELYDSSTKILYFKSYHPEFLNYKDPEFTFFADTVLIHSGYFWPAYSSAFPSTPFISTNPFHYQNHALGFEYLIQNKPDPRNDSRLMSAFKENNLLHAGLSVSIESLIIDGTQVSLSCIVINHDKDDLYILDYNKMGTNLFHYYTNGLVFVNKTQPEIVYCIINSQSPVPYDSWKMDWLSLLKSGNSIQLEINYTLANPLKNGTYVAYFNFPGLNYQISKDELKQENGRIWLGEVTGSKIIIIQ